MSTPTGDDGFLHELEQDVRAELRRAEASEPAEEINGVPIGEWLFDPVDVQREEIGLRNLLGAVEAMESAPSHPHGSHLAARDHCLSLVRAVDRPTGMARYGRMFPGLDPLGTDPQLLMRAGGNGGVCDAAAVLGGLGPGDDDAAEAAGWPFFGQLVAHDITADRSAIAGEVAPDALRNARAPKLNLEMLYSDGPIGSPYLFDLGDPATFLLGPDGADVPRNQQGVALIGDPRNDVHLFALTLHVALLHAHNRIVELLREAGVPDAEVFDRARITLTWHYQWIVVHDFLPRLVGRSLVERVLAEGCRWFTPPASSAYIPLEFADAAFRYGHGQIRHTYRLLDGGPAVPLFPDLVGFGPQPAGRRLDLAQVFDLPGRPPAQRAKRLDGRLATSLIGLPEQVTGSTDVAYRSLAVRDLLRGETTELPSGEAVAGLMEVPPLTADELEQSWPNGTPLWFYILKEAEHRCGGDRLGPVGGRIVAEVLIGLLRADPTSYLSLEPGWEPTLPAAGPDFGLADLLTLGGTRDR
ncbi:peroxidase family protein [Pseudonocardia cypriaca]|uniref:Heme peroxidase n=1 Tax=Pseudonocardia cypriaca TaxID=882449 RepID=A0A543FT53_9PSEU|nr:peroxidase family protein [Pseudonocardia cypriaca]TQM36924.1 heme peroxidase [Pseudonocardia cypriaca]